MKSQFKKFLIIITLIVIRAGAGWAQGGPIVLMGIDAEDRLGTITWQHGDPSIYAEVVRHILTQATKCGNTGKGILVIGGGKDSTDDVTTFWNEIDTDLGVSVAVTYVNGSTSIAAITSAYLASFKMIAVVSSVQHTPSGGLTQVENNSLATRQANIESFVNTRNGGLLGFTQDGLTNIYEYLLGLATITVTPVGFSDIATTAEGTVLGITDTNLDVSAWHEEYSSFPAFFETLATNAVTGEPAAIGGECVVIGEKKGAHEVDFFWGGLFTNDNSSLNSGFNTGFRYSRHYQKNFSVELETGIVFTDRLGQEGLLGHAQWQVLAHLTPTGQPVRPFLLVGVGLAWFNTTGFSDTSPVIVFGIGAKFGWRPETGFRIDVRNFRATNLLDEKASNNLQINWGVIFNF